MHGFEPARVLEKARGDFGEGKDAVVDRKLLLDEENKLASPAVKIAAVSVVKQQARALAVGEAAQGCGGEELVDEADDENDIRLAAGNQCRKRALVESRQAVETVAVSMPVERFAQGRAEPVEGSGALFQAVEMDARVAEFLERLGDFKAERDAGDPVEDQEIQFLVGHVNASSAARIVPVRTKGRQCALPRQCRVSQGPTTRPGPQSGRQWNRGLFLR